MTSSPCASAEEILRERGEERLRDGVVVGVAFGAHRDLHAGRAATLTEDQRDVLRALIGVVHEPGYRSSPRHSHLERVDDELGLEVGSHRPADDTTAVTVYDG